MSDPRPTIAIIGAGGTLGRGLVRRLCDVGYTVFSDPADTGKSADVVILAVPYAAELELAEKIGDALADRIVVSVSNPLTDTLDDVVTPHDESAAEHLALLMPHARVVKALNSLSASAFDIAPTDQPQFDTFVASDDREAAIVVEKIITDMGFRPWYAGRLILSRTLERMSALLIGVGMRYKLDGALGWRIAQVKPENESDV